MLKEVLKVNCMLHEKGFSYKPQGAEVADIVNGIRSTQIDIDELADRVGEFGQTFKTGYMSGTKDDSWISSQLFAIDIDNKDDKTGERVCESEYLTLEDAYRRCEQLGLIPNFMYYTLSSKPDYEKFRIVFATDYPINDERLRRAIQYTLMELFPQSDTACKNSGRLYYGGKGLKHKNSFATISPKDVIDAYVIDTKKYDPKHMSRKITNLCKIIGLNMTNNLPNTYINQPINFKDGYTISYKSKFYNRYEYFDFCITEEEARKSKNSTSKKNTKYDIDNCKSKAEYLERIDFELIKERCQLFREFCDGELEIHHQQLFGLGTSICICKGGQSLMLEALEQYPNIHNYDNKAFTLRDIPNRGYTPQSCKNFNCPYYDECVRYGVNPLGQLDIKRGGIKEMEKDYKVSKLDEVRKQLVEAISEAYESKDFDIHLIIAPTGAGKTYAYTKQLKLDNTCIAVPTNRLGDEVYKSIDDSNTNKTRLDDFDGFIKPSPLIIKNDIVREKIEKFYKLGLYKNARDFIEKYLQEYDMDTDERAEISHYLANNELLKGASRVLCTHNRALRLANSNIDTYIIDEDILPEIMKITVLDDKDLDNLINFEDGSCKLRMRLSAFKKEIKLSPVGACSQVRRFDIENKELNKVLAKNVDIINTDIKTILSSDFVFHEVHERDGKEVHEYSLIKCKKDALLLNKKYIILSATASESVYKWLFGDRVKVTKLDEIENEGEIQIHCSGASYSRFSIDSNTEKRLEYVGKFVDKGTNVICAKKFKKLFEDYNYDVITTFGATSGLNEYEGQDLAVIGTPHYNNALYYLYASVMGVDIDFTRFENQEVHVQTIERNGFQFSFNTFEDPVLREIQLYLIESELAQAVGRARVVSNKCVVHLFSNLPIKQSKIVK